jgi:hypothetical protein
LVNPRTGKVLRAHHVCLGRAASKAGKTTTRILTSFDELPVEVVTLRLVICAMLVYLACLKNDSAGQTLTEICGLLEGVEPYAVITPDLDEELRQAAILRARSEMADLVAGIQKLPIARP